MTSFTKDISKIANLISIKAVMTISNFQCYIPKFEKYYIKAENNLIVLGFPLKNRVLFQLKKIALLKMLDKNDFWQIEQKLQASKKKYWKEGSKKLNTGEKTLKDANYVDVLERERER